MFSGQMLAHHHLQNYTVRAKKAFHSHIFGFLFPESACRCDMY